MNKQQWIIDGMNVIGSRPDGWWRDLDAAIRRLVEQLQRLAEAEGLRLILVLDGAPLPDLPEGTHQGIEILYAHRPGPDAADDRIIALLSQRTEDFLLITSDRALRQRAESLGCAVESASFFLRRLEAT